MKYLQGNSSPSDHLRSLLRLEDEPCIYIDEMTCHNTMMLHCNEFMDQLQDFYTAWSETNSLVNLPYKQVFTDNEIKGDFRLMPCMLPEAKQKFVKVIGSNEEERCIKDKICVGKSLLIDHFDNHVFAILDVCALSSFRTAAISALAYKLCAKDAPDVALIGSGRIGFYTAYILHTWLGKKHFHVTDIKSQNQKNFLSLCEHYLPGVEVHMTTQEKCLQTSQAIFLTTDSEHPIVNHDHAKNIQFISSVGADADNLSELAPSLLNSYNLISDSSHSMALGDMKRWLQEGLLKKDQLTELKQLFGKHEPPQRTLFISTGIAVQDALINHFVYQKTEKRHA